MTCDFVPLGELATVVGGYTFKSGDFTSQGIPVVKIANVTWGGVDLSDCARLPDSFLAVRDKYHVKEGDVLISLTGSQLSQPRSVVGRVAQYRHESTALLNQRVGKIVPRNKDKCDLNFLFHYLRQEAVTYQLAVNAKGSANQANIGNGDVERLRVPAFSVEVQREIASILSAYDDLIENNRRRIQLLEQAARLLYREWFVHLRFPGHEHVTITDGVPEGWEKKPLGEVAPLKYGKALKKDDRVPGPFPVYGSSGIVGTHEKALVTGPAIIVGRKGNVGSVYWSKDDFHPIDTVYFVETEHCTTYLYYALLHTQFINTDVAVPGLNRDFAHSRTLLIPDDKILALFEQDVTIIHDQIDQLAKYNKLLTQARDLLLPRLMNGEVTV